MNLLDKFIGAVSPKWALSRQQYRDIYAAYRGGVGTRLSTTWSRNQSFTGGRQGDRANLGSMRDRARRVYQENAIGRSILNTETDNVVADGLNLQGRTSDPAFNSEVEARYHEWLKVCDISGMRDGIELQREAYRMSRRDGDGGIVLVDRGGHSRLQLIPGDLVQNPDGQWDPNYKDGVEIDRVGRPIAFHVLEQDEIGTRTFQRIGAGSFVFLSHYPETMITRGESCYATVFPLLDQLDAYVDAVVIAARMGAVFGLLFKSETAGKQFNSLPTLANSQGDQQKALTLENGQVRYLGAGDDVVQVNPSQPMANTPDFVRCILRLIGLPFDMPLELVLRDVSQSNLSSLRGALQDFRRACRIRRRAYAAHWSRIYLWWLEREIAKGTFTTPVPADWHKHELHARGWEFTDPVTDVQAAMMACEFGFDSPQNVMAQLGRDPEDMFRQNKEWRDKRTELKLPDARSTMTRDPMPPPAPPAPPGGPGGMPPKPPGVAPGGPAKQITAASGDNCGTGDGGFKPGNDCGGGGGNPYDANAPFGPLPRSQKMRRSTWEASQWYDDEADADLDIADISPAAQAKRQQAAKRALREYVATAKDADEGFFVKKKAREIADHVANAERKIHTFRGNRHLDKGFDEAQRVAKAEIDGPMRKQAEKAVQILRSNFDMTPREAWDQAGSKVDGSTRCVIRAAGENCGTGDGGFKPGNDCAAGGGAGGGGKAKKGKPKKGDRVKGTDRAGQPVSGTISSAPQKGSVFVTREDGSRTVADVSKLEHAEGGESEASPAPSPPTQLAAARVTSGVSRALQEGRSDFASLYSGAAGHTSRGGFEDYVRDLEASGAVTLQPFTGSDFEMDSRAMYVVRRGQVMEAASPTGRPLPPFQPKPQANTVWKDQTTEAVAGWKAQNPLVELPIPNLYVALKNAHPNLTAGQFHDGLRSLESQGKIALFPWTGSPAALAEKDPSNLAMVQGKEQVFYVSPGTKR